MAERKMTDEDWEKARFRYEREPGLGYGQLAQILDCSKNLVARRAKTEGWVKGQGVAVQVGKGASAPELKIAEKTVHKATSAAPVDPSAAENQGHVAPAPAVEPGDGDEMPENLSLTEQEQWVEAAVRRRQTHLQRKQAKELAAAKGALYGAIKDAKTKEGYTLARTARQIISAMTEQHASEMASEATRVRLELGQFHGVQGPRPCGIRVLIVPGMRIGEASPEPPAGCNAVQARDLGHACDLMRGAGEIVDVEAKNVD